MKLVGVWVGALVVAPTLFVAGGARAQGMTEAQVIAEAKTRTYEAMCPAVAKGSHMHRCFGQVLRSTKTEAIVPDATTPISGSISASDMVSAYNIPSAAKSGGAVIAVVDAYGAPNAYTGMSTYRTQYSIPALPKCAAGVIPKTGDSPCFAQVGQTGGTPPPVGTGQNAGWQLETDLDLDMVSAACPDCSIVLVEATDASNNLYTAVSEAGTLGAKYITNSWGGPEEGGVDTTLDGTTFNQAGVMIFAASGDQDFNDQDAPLSANSPNYPSTSPFVFGVGGTTLSSGGSARGWTEVVWSNANNGSQGGTGSGCSTVFATPTYQASLNMASCKMRGNADVSAVADAAKGISIYSKYGGGWTAVGGTSAATPLVTAILARLKIKGATPAYIYDHASAFYDVTSGNNNPDPSNHSCTDLVCNGAVGWDGPTGVGTPNATALANGGGNPTDGGTGTDSGSDSGSGDDGGADATTGDDGGTTGDDGGTTGDDGGTVVPGDDGGTVVPGDDGGGSGTDSGPTTGPATAPDGGSFSPDSVAKSGCGCTTPGSSTTPLEDTGIAALVLGSIALFGSRRRKR